MSVHTENGGCIMELVLLNASNVKSDSDGKQLLTSVLELTEW